ncbi:hypothetical protein OIU77_023709 [Salix suchowensis]|uniref:Late embryogenesis abundant protein LEA-2 subgroup domain-containing protein n=1 Tax=Salix suchowensis TaxID=1278906 RepID=A0ABQ9C8N1_9ROSI|nr:hypothetical protein OIU77_023709 [Salix suchowensis]
MALPKSTEPQPPLSPAHCYTLIPCDQLEGGATVLPFYRHRTTQYCRRWPMITTILLLLLLLLLSTVVYVSWPSDPTVKVVRLRLDRIHIHTLPIINVDISLYVTLKVRNVDVYSMDFRSLDVAVKYRGKRLGHVSVLSDVVSLLDDLARGTVPFDTVTEVSGRLGLFFFGFPLEAKLFCAVLVNTNNQTIVRQTCYPER